MKLRRISSVLITNIQKSELLFLESIMPFLLFDRAVSILIKSALAYSRSCKLLPDRDIYSSF